MNSKQRSVGIDNGRLIAAFGVIVIHVKPVDALGTAITEFFWVLAVSFFYLSSLRFVFAKLLTQPSTQITAGLHRRILLPYFVWTVIYALLILAKSRLTPTPKNVDWIGLTLYGQSAVHLYFLPIITWLHCVTIASYHLLRRRPVLQVLVALPLLIAYPWYGYSMHYIGWSFLTAFPLFIVSAYLLESFDPFLQRWKLTTPVGALMLSAAVLMRLKQVSVPLFPFPIEFFLGGLGFYLAMVKLSVSHKLFPVQASFAIYLSHIFFLEGFEFLLERFGMKPHAYTAAQMLSISFCILLSCICFYFVSSRSRIMRRCLLGDN